MSIVDHIGRLAQSVERGANKAKVLGSRPTLAMYFIGCCSVAVCEDTSEIIRITC